MKDTPESVALAALAEVEAYFENRQDVNDGDYGQPEPNEEMRMLQELFIVRRALTPTPQAAPALPATDDLIHAGNLLANCAYNLAQSKSLGEADRRTLDQCRQRWDTERAVFAGAQAAPGGEDHPDVNYARQVLAAVMARRDEAWSEAAARVLGKTSNLYRMVCDEAATHPARSEAAPEPVAWRYLRHLSGNTYAWTRWLGMEELHHYGPDGNLVKGPHPDWRKVEYAYAAPLPAQVDERMVDRFALSFFGDEAWDRTATHHNAKVIREQIRRGLTAALAQGEQSNGQ